MRWGFLRTDDLDERETPFANQPPGTPDAREESIGEGAMREAPRAPGDPRYERKVPKRETLQYNARRSRFPSAPPGGNRSPLNSRFEGKIFRKERVTNDLAHVLVEIQSQ